jgi:two-component system, NtrC family, sensor kinase
MNTATSETTESSRTASSLPTDTTHSLSFDPAYAESHDRHLLIVDDEECVRRLFADYLSEDYSCKTAADAQEALDLLSRESFALVISDMQMPGLGGVELLRKITERYLDTAVIMVSGIDRTQRVIDAIRMGASDYLLKPCELNVLTASVERALERRMLLRNARRYKHDLENRNAELARRKTEMERLQAQILHAEKMASLGQLAAGVAHELNNPAGFIFSNVDLLTNHLDRLQRCLCAYDDVLLSPDDAVRISSIKKEIDYENIMADLGWICSDCHLGAARIRDVVLNLRLFSRLDEAEVKRVDIHEGIESTIRLLSRYYSAGKITLRRDYGDISPVNCYAAQLNQVWMNVLANAAQAVGEAEGEVSIRTNCDGQTVRISISDTGRGMEPEQITKIFDPFFTTKPVGEGTGLGLSTSHGIIERHGGTIGVESTPGQGTTFTICLPLDANQNSAPAK